MTDLTREKLITGNAKAMNSLFSSSGFNTAPAALNHSHVSGKRLLGESCFFAGRAELGLLISTYFKRSGGVGQSSLWIGLKKNKNITCVSLVHTE